MITGSQECGGEGEREGGRERREVVATCTVQPGFLTSGCTRKTQTKLGQSSLDRLAPHLPSY